jgi:superfamily II DNA/RNA helicase
VRARTVANQVAIQKACETHDLKKIFSFHRKIESAREFTSDAASSITAHLPTYAAYHVNGNMRTADRERLMTAFREADYAIMSNARCLTEGVDVPAVDVVAFLAPRKSKVDIVQAAGRAMRKSDPKETGYAKEMGYVLLPLFLETHKNETLEDAVKRTDFEDAWDVLQAMKEQDAVLADIIREMREERGRLGGFDDSRLCERVEVLGPEVSLDVLRAAVTTAIVDHLVLEMEEERASSPPAAVLSEVSTSSSKHTSERKRNPQPLRLVVDNTATGALLRLQAEADGMVAVLLGELAKAVQRANELHQQEAGGPIGAAAFMGALTQAAGALIGMYAASASQHKEVPDANALKSLYRESLEPMLRNEAYGAMDWWLRECLKDSPS